MAERTDGLDLRIRVTGDSDSVLDTRNVSHVPRLTQRLPYSRPPVETNWSKPSPRTRENPVVTDGTQPARVRPYVSPHSHGAAYLIDSVKNWEPFPVNKSNSSLNTFVSINTQHRSGSLDPRFRKIVANRKSNKSDIATDKEDLTNEKRECSHPHETGDDKPAEGSQGTTVMSNMVEKDKAEKPEEVTVPLKKTQCVDCGVQTPEITCKVIQKHKESKIHREIRCTANEISLDQSSCDTKRSHSEASFNCNAGKEQCSTEKLHINKILGETRIGEWIQECKKKQTQSHTQGDQNKEKTILEQKPHEHDINEHMTSRKFHSKSELSLQYAATEDDDWQTLEVHKYPANENESSLCIHLPEAVTAEKLVKQNIIGYETRSTDSKKLDMKCGCGVKRHARESSTNVSQKGSSKRLKDSCLHYYPPKPNSNEMKDDGVKFILMILGGIFVVTASFWVFTILIGFIPALYEWFYPPPDDSCLSCLFAKVFGSNQR